VIPDDVIDEVRLRADLVEVVSESVPLKRSGKEWKGKCPFHEDRTPSFYVVPDKGFYKCFGCGESGDVFTFVMKRSGMEFLDAVRHLGERFGVEIREVKGRSPEEDPNRPLYEVNAFARAFFRACLADKQKGASARAYLKERGIDDETAERFGLGFAPDAWRDLKEAASAHEIPEEVLLEVGLLTTSPKSPDPYDRFRNRVIFPIETAPDRTVAFGGRVLGTAGEGVPKYLNSPESPVYHKGTVLYGLSWNRNGIRREGAALVVEGYMDVVTLAAAGVGTAVATLGTAMTEEHARLLRRYTEKVLLLFDSDEAGLRATFRAADVLLARGIRPSVVTLPPGEDPDTVVRKEGAEGLTRYLDGAVDVLDRKLQLLDERGFFETSDRVRTAVDKLLPTLRATSDPALRDIYISRVAERTGVRRKTLEEEVERGRAETRATPGGERDSGWSGPGRPPPTQSRGGGRRPRLPPMGAERQVLLVLLRTREWVDRVLERIGPEEFHDPVHRAIFEALAEDPDRELPAPGMPPDVARRVEDLLGDPEELIHTGRVFDDSVADLRDRSLRKRQKALEEELRSAGSDEEQRRLLEELNQVRRERRGARSSTSSAENTTKP
jgi:DNA primase